MTLSQSFIFEKHPNLWFNGQFLRCTNTLQKQNTGKKRQKSCQQNCILRILQEISRWVVWYISLAELLRESLLFRCDSFSNIYEAFGTNFYVTSITTRPFHPQRQRQAGFINLSNFLWINSSNFAKVGKCSGYMQIHITAKHKHTALRAKGPKFENKSFTLKETWICHQSLSTRTWRLTDTVRKWCLSWQISRWF